MPKVFFHEQATQQVEELWTVQNEKDERNGKRGILTMRYDP
jgi:hypothetical protein